MIDYSLFYAGRKGVLSAQQGIIKQDVIDIKATKSSLAIGASTPAVSTPMSASTPTNPFGYVKKIPTGPKDQSRELEELRRRKQRANALVIISHPDGQWKREVHGGVKMWVNASSGEISLHQPKNLPPQSEMSVRSSVRGNPTTSWRLMFRKTNRVACSDESKKRNETSLRSTERTVYKNPEMKELMDLFDNRDSGKKIRIGPIHS